MRPSAIMGMETAIGEIEIDTACIYFGRRAEKAVADGKDPLPKKSTDTTKTQTFVDPRKFKRAKKRKIKADGTW